MYLLLKFQYGRWYVFGTMRICLTGCNSYDEAIELAANGDNFKVDKSIRDVYGDSNSGIELPGKLVASR